MIVDSAKAALSSNSNKRGTHGRRRVKRRSIEWRGYVLPVVPVLNLYQAGYYY
jgi:hypothetical protein